MPVAEDELNRALQEKARLERLLEQRDLEVESLKQSLANARAHAVKLAQQLEAVVNSTTWRATWPVRRVLQRYPRLARRLGRVARFSWWTLSLQLPQKLRERRADIRRAGLIRSAAGQAAGYYGDRPLAKAELSPNGGTPGAPVWSKADVSAFEKGTERIIERFRPAEGGAPSTPWMRWMPIEDIRRVIDTREPRFDMAPNAAHPSYSIITPFYRHLGFFQECAASVAALMRRDQAPGQRKLEWVIVNDDPSVNDVNLMRLVPEDIRSCVTILSDGENRGIAARLNQAAQTADGEWLLLLDCDDMISDQAAAVLDHYCSRFERCRYISSTMLDIDENGALLRRRVRGSKPADLLETGMIAGHLVAIRRDFFDELGGYAVIRSGCQDYDLALRAAFREPILLIPEALYLYRWHGRSQSVSAGARQNATANEVRREAIMHFLNAHAPSQAERPMSKRAAPELRRGLCAIRTQGKYLDLLGEAVESVLVQKVSVLPLVIVHGDGKCLENVHSYFSARGLDPVILHAPDVSRKRGYPLNVALDYLRAGAEAFDFFCILDSDDIYYPMFAQQMAEAMELSGADVVYCQSNSRELPQAAAPGHLPLPAPCLITANFIPTNALAVRTSFLLAHDLRFNESLDYLEDWYFLLELLQAGARFQAVWSTLCEYRIIGDGNRHMKARPALYAECEKTVGQLASRVADRLGKYGLAAAALEFDFERRGPFSPDAIHIMDSTQHILDQAKNRGVRSTPECR